MRQAMSLFKMKEHKYSESILVVMDSKEHVPCIPFPYVLGNFDILEARLEDLNHDPKHHNLTYFQT